MRDFLRLSGALGCVVLLVGLFFSAPLYAQNDAAKSVADNAAADAAAEELEILRRLLDVSPGVSEEPAAEPSPRPAESPTAPKDSAAPVQPISGAAEADKKAAAEKAAKAKAEADKKAAAEKAAQAKAEADKKAAAEKAAQAKAEADKKAAAEKAAKAKAEADKKAAAEKAAQAKAEADKKAAAEKAAQAKAEADKKAAAEKAAQAKAEADKKAAAEKTAKAKAEADKKAAAEKAAQAKAEADKKAAADKAAKAEADKNAGADKAAKAKAEAEKKAAADKAAKAKAEANRKAAADKAAKAKAEAAKTAAAAAKAKEEADAKAKAADTKDAAAGPPGDSAGGFSAKTIPTAGTVISTGNVTEWSDLLIPSLEWAIASGATLRVADYTPVTPEPVRQAATQKYHEQTSLSEDGTQMLNYVAGLPFPFVTEADPHAAIKLIFNSEARILHDDVDTRNFECQSGELNRKRGMKVERSLLIDHFRRLYFVGRMHSEPKPTWDLGDDIRYREMLFPVTEPFDLKGAGFTYNRYRGSDRQDDSWVYAPQQRRVRRLSTAQRSEGQFGTDIDLDSYGGWAGNPSWMSWKLLGRKTLLASIGAEEFPGKWQAPPADFMYDDVWQPREIYVIEARPKVSDYAFGRRIIYVDREAFLIPLTELYDLKGQLWKALAQTWKIAKPGTPLFVTRDTADVAIIPAITLFDMQLQRGTRCLLPSPRDMPSRGYHYNLGPEGNITNDLFDVSNFIGAGR